MIERGRVYYDGDCSLCVGLAGRWRGLLERRGFRLEPLQAPGVAQRLGVAQDRLLDEMRVQTADGRAAGGADALILLAGELPWARPLTILAKLPGVMPALRSGYRFVAARRSCAIGACSVRRRSRALPAALLLGAIGLCLSFRGRLEPWAFMWLMAISIFFASKWWTIARLPPGVYAFRPAKALAYLMFWPGMDPLPFAEGAPAPPKPSFAECLFASLKLFFGLVLFLVVAPLSRRQDLLAGWIAMTGIVLILHFGAFHWFALFWRHHGVPVEPLMRWPIASVSLGEFWGRRWNAGFRQLGYDLVFAPLHRAIGVGTASLLVFLISGLLHELVISAPARAGYGLPTGYFLIQGFGAELERSKIGRKIGLGRGILGRLFTIAVVAGPAYWLFHPPFVRRVIIPFMEVFR